MKPFQPQSDVQGREPIFKPQITQITRIEERVMTARRRLSAMPVQAKTARLSSPNAQRSAKVQDIMIHLIFLPKIFLPNSSSSQWSQSSSVVLLVPHDPCPPIRPTPNLPLQSVKSVKSVKSVVKFLDSLKQPLEFGFNRLLSLTKASVAAILVTVSGVAAQAAEEPAAIRLLAFSRAGEDMEMMVTDKDGLALVKEPLALPTQQFSPVAKVPGRTLFFRNKAQEPKLLASVVLPATGREFVLVFFPQPATAALPYKVQAVELATERFGSGDYAFFNVSGRNLGCLIGKQKLMLPAGKCEIFKPARGVATTTLICYERAGDAWATTPFFSSRLIVQQGVRNLILIGVDPKTGAVDFRGVPDFLAGPKQTAAK